MQVYLNIIISKRKSSSNKRLQWQDKPKIKVSTLTERLQGRN